MSVKYFSQLSIADHFHEHRNFFEADTPTFLTLLKSTLIYLISFLTAFIPPFTSI